jgi:arginyl-tRNA synthetase
MPDIAYHVHKFANRKFDHVINIWGADHHSDVKRLQIGVELARKTEKFQGELTILITQLVRLVRDGKEVKMSKRAGTYVALDELLEEVEVDVARFFFLMRGFDTHMDFDLDLAKEQSQKNPVFYLKYAFARIAGILRQGVVAAKADLSKLEHPAELTLIKELAEFPDLIERTAADYQIQRVPHYALKLADSFHQFYEQCRVITDDKELTQVRLKLVEATRIVLQNVGDTLGITMPERM